MTGECELCIGVQRELLDEDRKDLVLERAEGAVEAAVDACVLEVRVRDGVGPIEVLDPVFEVLWGRAVQLPLAGRREREARGAYAGDGAAEGQHNCGGRWRQLTTSPQMAAGVLFGGVRSATTPR